MTPTNDEPNGRRRRTDDGAASERGAAGAGEPADSTPEHASEPRAADTGRDPEPEAGDAEPGDELGDDEQDGDAEDVDGEAVDDEDEEDGDEDGSDRGSVGSRITRSGAGEGLTGRSRRGVVGEHWWAHRWCDLLAETGRTDRLHRGRVLARTGSVFGFRVEIGAMRGEVRQSRAELHEASLAIPTWNTHELAQALEEIASRARYGASLLAGGLDPTLDDALRARGVHLFPDSFDVLGTRCSCAEPSPPCPHVAALIYLFAERIDRNPFLMLRLRGIRREPLLEECRRRRSTGGFPSVDEGDLETRFEDDGDDEGRARPPYFGDEAAIIALDPRPLGDQTNPPLLDELGLPPRVEPETFSALAVTEAYMFVRQALSRVLRRDQD